MRRPQISLSRLTALFIVAFLCLLGARAFAGDDEETPSWAYTIAIASFENKSRYRSLATVAHSQVTRMITESQRFQVVERNKLDRVLEEQRLSVTDLLDPSTAIELGKLLGARYSLVGRITEGSVVETPLSADVGLRAIVGIEIKIIDNKTGEVLLTATDRASRTGFRSTSSYESLLHSTVPEVIYQLKGQVFNAFLPSGVVVKIYEDKMVLLDIGKRDGIKKGQKLLVYRSDAPVRHPTTNLLIPGRRYEIGEVEIVSLESTTSTAKIKKLKDKKRKMAPGDEVQSKKTKKSAWDW